MIPEPSPSTKPSRSTSNGREARSGSSLRVLIARIWENPAIGMLVMHASAPPATTTSASPALIIRQPQASASAPDAHADTGACTPALRAQLQPDVGGRTVRHEHRDGQRGDLAQPLGLQEVVLAEQGQRAADARYR